jgi:cytochrome oxidase Cu insertion factor (SCO1/SenC/PrrC family)
VAGAGSPAIVGAHGPAPAEPVFTQAPFTASYTPPPAGTYELPALRQVPAFTLVDSEGRRVSTSALARGRLSVVSFIYTSCSDRFGCPLASATMRELQERLREADLLARVTLLSITVDPARDRPARLAHYARAFGADPAVWHFLTASSDAGIRPVLDAYGQDRQPVHDDRGRVTGAYRHVLKVFLVDARGFIRNIYSTGFLVPAVVVNDVTTVLHEDRQARR